MKISEDVIDAVCESLTDEQRRKIGEMLDKLLEGFQKMEKDDE